VRSAEARSHHHQFVNIAVGMFGGIESSACSKVAALCLLALDGLEERFKVCPSQAATTFALD